MDLIQVGGFDIIPPHEGNLSAESENSVGYSGGINVDKAGHEGGYRFCDLAVECIGKMFNDK